MCGCLWYTSHLFTAKKYGLESFAFVEFFPVDEIAFVDHGKFEITEFYQQKN